MREAGFEPAHPEIVGLKSTALDHSAIRATFFISFLFLFFGVLFTPISYTSFLFKLFSGFGTIIPTSVHVQSYSTTCEFARNE